MSFNILNEDKGSTLAKHPIDQLPSCQISLIYKSERCWRVTKSSIRLCDVSNSTNIYLKYAHIIEHWPLLGFLHRQVLPCLTDLLLHCQFYHIWDGLSGPKPAVMFHDRCKIHEDPLSSPPTSLWCNTPLISVWNLRKAFLKKRKKVSVFSSLNFL